MIFKRFSIFLVVQLVLSAILILAFSIIGIFVYFNERENTFSFYQNKFYGEIDELDKVIELYRVRDRDILNMAARFAEYKINEYSDFEESDSATIDFDAVNPFTKQPMTIKIHEWFVDDMSFLNNFYIVDEIKTLTKVNASVYQKTPKGYVNISTNIINTEEDRLLGDIILNSSEVVQAIEQGNQYRSRFYKNNSSYLSLYKPIYINGKVRGMYYLDLKERIGRALKTVFDGRKYFESGYAFIITKEGKLSVHPKESGMDYSTTGMFQELVKYSGETGTIIYRWPENEQAQNWHLHFKYYDSIDSWVCISYPRSELYRALNIRALYVVFWFVLFFIVFQFALVYLNNRRKGKLKTVSRSVALIAKSGNPDKLRTRDFEYKNLYDNLNAISMRFDNLEKYALKLLNDGDAGQLDLSEDDKIGNVLVQVDKKLIKAANLEKEGEKENRLRKWESDGLSKFVGILQQHTNDISELSYMLVNNLVEYLNANQGALFFLNNENPDDIYFEQMATYAYDKRRLITKKIYPEEGLIGRIYSEKKTINLSEIPDNYLKITSGLGELEPNYLLIVPLLLNMEVYGAIELASFNKFEDYQIEFIEKIGENVASTINNVQINTRTRKLLEQSREQSEKLAEHEGVMKNSMAELENAKSDADTKSLEMEGILNAVNASLLVAEFSVNGDVLKVNDNYTSLFQLKHTDLIGRNHSEFTTMNIELAEYKLFWKDLQNGKARTIEEKIKLPDETEYWLSGSYSPVFDKNKKVYKILNISIDITKVKELENKLQQEKK